jgi:hypothetical protein
MLMMCRLGCKCRIDVLLHSEGAKGDLHKFIEHVRLAAFELNKVLRIRDIRVDGARNEQKKQKERNAPARRDSISSFREE